MMMISTCTLPYQKDKTYRVDILVKQILNRFYEHRSSNVKVKTYIH